MNDVVTRYVAGASLLGALVVAGAASAAPAPPAIERCGAAWAKQYYGGVAARGGPKHAFDTGEIAGIAPLNCDHYWQGIGAIGKNR